MQCKQCKRKQIIKEGIIEGRKEGIIEGRKEGRKEGQKEGWKEGWMDGNNREGKGEKKKSEFVQYSTFVLATYIPAVKSLCLACCALYTCRISLPPNSTSLRTWQCSKKSIGRWTVDDLVLALQTFFFFVGRSTARGLEKIIPWHYKYYTKIQ